MLYQLPNGKVIHLSIDEYLSLSDDELNHISRSFEGEPAPTKMFYGKKRNKTKPLEKPDINKDIDYSIDHDEIHIDKNLDLNDLAGDL